MLKINFNKFIYNNYTSVIIFVLFVFIYSSFGLFLTYFSNIITDINYDMVYSIDSGATFWQLFINDRFAAMKHPLIHILINPIIFLLKGYIANPKLVAVVLQSVLQSGVVVFVYKILYKLTKKRGLASLFSILYGFSYTALLMATFTDVYVYAAFGQVLFFSYFLYCYNNPENKLKFNNKVILVLLAVIGYGINLINIVSCGIFILFLFCKEYKTQWKKLVTETIKIAGAIALLILILLQCQTYIFNIEHRTSGVGHVRLGYEKGKIINTLRGTYVEPIYSLKSAPAMELNEYEKQDGTNVYFPRYLTLDKQNVIRYFPALFILLVPLIFYIKNHSKYKNKSIINLLLAINVIYTIFNYSFYSYECALFALNYFPFLIILLGLLYENFDLKIRNFIIGTFLIYEVFINILNLFKIHDFLSKYGCIPHSYLFCAFISAVVLLFLYFAIKILKKITISQNINLYSKDSYCLWISAYSALVIFYFLFGCLNRFIS